ncbi:hypothetical protein MC885_012540 [Smutsia gigantea]|nr:hypothetical protein MC885_012540 [Smutsia gigantea]
MHRAVLACVAVSWLTAMAEGLQVTVPDKKKVAMLFQPAVLRCHYATSSHQPAVVQWKFKSYCQDRMGESLGMSSSRAQALSKRNLEWDPYLDCLDSRRTVRVVASKQGSTITLGDFYRGREITIVHDADLQIGKLLWGDSGLYSCIVTTPDDLEGKNEESVELLVLGKEGKGLVEIWVEEHFCLGTKNRIRGDEPTGVHIKAKEEFANGRTGLLADLLPSFAVEIMPEWVFVGLVILGVALLSVLLGICWCQCCPHSCCCYVRCPCCPDSCCCPQALYAAGKAAKAGYPPPVSGVPGPYSIPSVPLGGAPSSGMLMDKPHPPPLAPSDSTGGSHSVRKGYRIQADKERDSMKVLYYVEKELAQFDPARRMRSRYNNTISELSSLHEEDSGFRQSYHQMRSKQFPMPGELECDPDYWSGVMGGSSGTSRGPSVMDYDKEDWESFRRSQPRSKSEMLSRKNFAAGIPAVSMDELAALAEPFGPRVRRADGNGHEARAPAGFHPAGSLEGRPGPRGRREPPGADRWGHSPARRRPEDAALPRLVSRTPGAGPPRAAAWRRRAGGVRAAAFLAGAPGSPRPTTRCRPTASASWAAARPAAASRPPPARGTRGGARTPPGRR